MAEQTTTITLPEKELRDVIRTLLEARLTRLGVGVQEFHVRLLPLAAGDYSGGYRLIVGDSYGGDDYARGEGPTLLDAVDALLADLG